jgi:hypothetical protein
MNASLGGGPADFFCLRKSRAVRWCKTNVAVAQRSVSGVRLLPTADLTFLKDVWRAG